MLFRSGANPQFSLAAGDCRTKGPAAIEVPAGLPVGQNAHQRPYDHNRPYDQFVGTGIDPSLLRAPLVGPDGREVAPPGPFADFIARVKSVFVKTPPPQRTIPYAPGISRRNRERAEQRMWRRD